MTTADSKDNQITNSSALLEEDKIKAILGSDASLSILAQRLKQSIKACEEFANFITRKYHCEQKYAKDTTRIVNHCDHSIISNNIITGGSFIQSLQRVIQFDEKVNSVRGPYITALQNMGGQLESLAQHFTTLRNNSKRKLEKVRSSDKNQTKITLQGRKTNSQQEEDLRAKIKDAEDDYNKKANASQRMKNTLINTQRPQISNDFKNLIVELDYAMQIQLQKYSIYTESFIVGMGNQINPINGTDSMKKIATNVDIEKCLYFYLKGSTIRKNENLVPVEFVRHPIVDGVLPRKQNPNIINPGKRRDFSNASKTISTPVAAVAGAAVGVGVGAAKFNASSNSYNTQPLPDQPSQSKNINTNNFHSDNLPPVPSIPALDVDSSVDSSYNSLDPGRNARLNGPKPYMADNNDSMSSFNDTTLGSEEIHRGKLFGLPLESLEVNEEAVPFFVLKCIKLIETYGSNFEGIYRLSPNKAVFEELKTEIDNHPESLSLLDPKDPTNVSPDYVYTIASLLKKFFSSLPEPLLTNEQRDLYLQAAELSDKTERQTKIHQLVFELPDSNYFTLRDMLGHFRKLIAMPAVRMDSKNISIVWANNLLGGDFESRQELETQQRVVEDLIEFAPSIFTYDDN
ncbi:hypothetical protein CANINC_002635 [Pichia inconspicua]|uniref:Rho-GAP domain-containing protein n=1 Tax=Pichia inconspicua TaxID=52247 RepID=A0A4T0X0Q2_9ASCO|nr:hypothetical protein CANINC_002635 [[Candida] inconspicua]